MTQPPLSEERPNSVYPLLLVPTDPRQRASAGHGPHLHDSAYCCMRLGDYLSPGILPGSKFWPSPVGFAGICSVFLMVGVQNNSNRGLLDAKLLEQYLSLEDYGT